MAKPCADSVGNARLRVRARAVALPAHGALFRPGSRLVPLMPPCFGRALRPPERVSSRGDHFQARLDWRISRGGAGNPAPAQEGGRLDPRISGEALATQRRRKRKLGASSQAELKEFNKKIRMRFENEAPSFSAS